MSDETSKTRRVTLRKEIAGLIWLALGLFLLLCLVSFNQGDPSWNTSIRPDEISNLGGVVGAYLADILFQTFGLPALLLPLACFLVAWRLLRMRELRFRLQRTLAFFALLLSLAGLLALRFKQIPLFGSTLDEAGGAAGRILVYSLSSLLNITGTAIVLSVFFLVSLMLSTRFSLVLFLSDRLDRLGRGIEQRRDQRVVRRQQKAKEKGESLEKGPVIAQPVPQQQIAANDSSKKKNKKIIW